jgi:DNA polymerase-3 subunit delta'
VTTAVASEEPGELEALWARVIGQERAVAELRASVEHPVHAYLLVGPRGCGKRALARAFAASLLSAGCTAEDVDRHARHVSTEQHPDLLVTERVGAAISAEQADDVVRAAQRSPVEGDRKVLLLDEFHLVAPTVAPKLLKTIEEAPAGTFFLVLAEEVPPELETIASRCVRVELGPVPPEAVRAALAADGVPPEVADEAALAAAGDLRRARVLATDPQLVRRRRAWFDVAADLDGTGATVVRLVDEVLVLIDEAAEPLKVRQTAESAELEDRVKELGERGSGRKALEDRHRRELRRHRVDELRFGLAVLARRYRDAMAASERPGPYVDALAAVQATAEGLVRNPNERLQLQALLLQLPALPPTHG